MAEKGDALHTRTRARTRIDKKREVKATISIELKEAIHNISNITRTPLKDIGEYLTKEMLNRHKTYVDLNQFMHRDIKFDLTAFRGHPTNPQIPKRIGGMTERIAIRFKRTEYDAIYNLSFALAVSPSRTVGILLDMAMKDIDVVNGYVKDYLRDQLTDGDMNELKALLRFINRDNNDHHSWLSLLTTILNKNGSAMLRMREIVQKFLDDYWKSQNKNRP